MTYPNQSFIITDRDTATFTALCVLYANDDAYCKQICQAGNLSEHSGIMQTVAQYDFIVSTGKTATNNLGLDKEEYPS